MEMYSKSNQNCEEVIIEDGSLETRDGSLGAKMKWFWFRRTGLEKVLLSLVFLLLVSLIAVIAVLLINTRDRPPPPTTTTTTSTSYPDTEGAMEICMDDHCISAAGEIISSMDLLADPCVDFYQYACGNWLRNNPLPENKKWMTFHIKTAEDVFASCNKILKEEIYVNNTNDILWKMKTFFKSCLNKDLIERDGAGPLLDVLAEFGGINTEEQTFAEDENISVEEITNIFRKSFLASGSSILVSIQLTNEHIRIMPYCLKPMSQAEVENETNFINETLSYLYPNGSPEVISRLALDFIEVHTTLVNCSSHSDIGNLTTLQTLVPKINWTGLIFSLVPKRLQHYEIQMYAEEYFRVLGNLLENKPFRLIKHYIIWRALRPLLPHTGGYISEISRKYQEYTDTSKDRDEFCMNVSFGYLEDALAGLFLSRNINSEDIRSQISLYEQVKESFKELVENNDEFDNTSKDVILETIDKMKVEVAHPEYISNYSLLNDAFRSLQIGDHFVTNLIAVRKYASLYRVSGELSVVTGIIREYTSAAYAPYTVIIPLLSLLRPSLSVAKSRSLMFSSVGLTMGHELSHSMDRWNSHEWAELTETGRDVFEGKMSCLKKLLESSMAAEYGDKNIIFQNFEREFWSDVSGLQISYEAFKKSPPDRFTLPYLNKTLDQIFYLNFAQILCGHEGDYQFFSRYPPLKYRVLATLRNSYNFSEAFGCPKGSPMNPQMEKCYIWHSVPAKT